MDNYINLSDKAVIDLFIFLRADNSSFICGSIVNKLPIKSISMFHRLDGIYQKLDEQNRAIYGREQQLKTLEQKLSEVKGMFKGKEWKQLQEQMEQLRTQIENIKR